MKAGAGFALALLLALVIQAGVAEEPPTWREVSVIFVERCVMCHSDKGAGRELRLDSYGGVVSGSINGPVVIAGNAESSELIRRLRGQSQPRMPFLSYPLPEEQIDLIARWIEGGLLREADDATNLHPSIEASGAVQRQ
jgi:hypothetical protein